MYRTGRRLWGLFNGHPVCAPSNTADCSIHDREKGVHMLRIVHIGLELQARYGFSGLVVVCRVQGLGARACFRGWGLAL